MALPTTPISVRRSMRSTVGNSNLLYPNLPNEACVEKKQNTKKVWSGSSSDEEDDAWENDYSLGRSTTPTNSGCRNASPLLDGSGRELRSRTIQQRTPPSLNRLNPSVPSSNTSRTSPAHSSDTACDVFENISQTQRLANLPPYYAGTSGCSGTFASCTPHRLIVGFITGLVVSLAGGCGYWYYHYVWNVDDLSWMADWEIPNATYVMEDFNVRFSDRVVPLFPNQDDHIWFEIKASAKSIMKEAEPIQPGVITLVAAKGAEIAAACLAKQIAITVTESLKAHGPVHIQEFNSRSASAIKQELDNKINWGLSRGGRAVILENLQRIPGESAWILHAFCDNVLAPYKRVLYIFTLEMNELPPGCRREISDTDDFEVTSHWRGNMQAEHRLALESRLSPYIAHIKPEYDFNGC